MADEYEQYHVPQQSRRDKLRVVNPQQQGCVDYLQSCAPTTLYDPSSLHNISIVPSDLLTCSSSAANVHHQQKSFNLYAQNSIFSPGMSSYVDPTSNPRALLNDNGGQGPYGYTSAQDNYRGSFDNVVVNASQSLSLSLSSHNNNNNNNNDAQNSSNHNHVVPLELNLQRYDYDFGGGSGNSNFLTGNSVSGSGSGSVELCRSAVPLGPFTGYASVLKKPRFLKPAQQLLEELCDNGGVCVEKMDSSLLDSPLLEGLADGNDVIGDHEALSFSGDGSSEQIRKKSRLLSMLDEVYKRYKLYYQQMQAVVSSFESVAGLSNAAPFASLALKSLSKHFKCLKNTITEQLQFTIKYHHGKASYERDESQRLDNPGMGSYGQRPFQSPRFVDQPVWRPQRGLPERAVSVLRAWLFEHFLHPYPTDTDKMMLAKQTGLSRNQVSNWFINARVRLWKPMVEEIHMLETRQGQKQPQREEPSSANRPNDHNMPTSSSVDCENASTSFQGIGEFPLKRSREETETPAGPMNLHYENVQHHHPHLGGGMSNAGGSGGVSLTLGLHQNNVALSEPYPMNAARRFGLDAHGEAYMLSGFATQNRQYG